jgi:osmoprotectant transport system permease protein
VTGDDVLRQAFVWLNDPLNWRGPDGVPALVAEHLAMSAAAVALAALVALPLGVWLGHRGRGGGLTVLASNTSRALPTLALLYVFATTGLGFGNRPTVVAAAIFAVPPILSNAFTGLREVDPAARDAARGMGMSGRRSLLAVELPLALPLIAAGLRTAAVQVVATVPLAALVGGGGLGTIIVTGFATRRFGEVVAGGLLVAALCLLVEALLAWGQRVLTPAPMRVRAGARTLTAAA